MPHHGFFGHKRNASFAQTLTPQCRTAWLRHRHERSNIIKLQPTKTRAQDEKDVEKEEDREVGTEKGRIRSSSKTNILWASEPRHATLCQTRAASNVYKLPLTNLDILNI